MDLIRAVVLVVDVLVIGLMAGVFFAFSTSVMPGLRRVDDRTFVGAFQGLDRAILNPLFLSVFLGPLIFTAVAALLHLGEDRRSALAWLVAAFVLYLAAFVVTMRVHVPRNNALKAAGDPDQVDAAVRERFDEALWLRWNTLRVWLSLAALACVAVGALVSAG